MPDRRLRFCMITTFYPPYNFGGDGIFVHRLSNELARRGHRVDVIHCIDAYRLAAHSPALGYQDHSNITVHGLKSRFGPLSPLLTQQTGHPVFKSAAIRQVLEQEFDVIHYHNISLVGGPKVLEYGRAIKLYTMVEYWLICPTNVLFRFNRAPCTRPHCVACSLVYKRPPQWWRYLGLLKTAVKHVDTFIAPSRFSRDIHRKMGLDAPIVELPYFVASEEAFPPEPEDAAAGGAGRPYFLFVGRLEKLKGLHTIIPIFRDYPKARLLVAGTGNYEPTLRRLAGPSDNIRFLGYVADQKLRRLYGQALGLIVPSICYDAAPLVIMETFRERTPAIVRNLGGMPEMVDEGGGEVYDTQEELVAAMDRLVADPSYRQEAGQRAYAAYKHKWTAEAHLDRYLGLIREIATRDPRRG